MGNIRSSLIQPLLLVGEKKSIMEKRLNIGRSETPTVDTGAKTATLESEEETTIMVAKVKTPLMSQFVTLARVREPTNELYTKCVYMFLTYVLQYISTKK